MMVFFCLALFCLVGSLEAFSILSELYFEKHKKAHGLVLTGIVNVSTFLLPSRKPALDKNLWKEKKCVLTCFGKALS